MQRWAIELDQDVRRRLTREQLELGTEIAVGKGTLLVFRDRFVGLRVASAVGARLHAFSEREFAPA